MSDDILDRLRTYHADGMPISVDVLDPLIRDAIAEMARLREALNAADRERDARVNTSAEQTQGNGLALAAQREETK